MVQPTILLVTGANSGIGYETVKVFLEASRSYHVLLGARSLDKAQEALKKAQQEVGSVKNTAETLEIDVTSDESITRAYEQVEVKHGRLDVLINNAGATFDIAHSAGKVTLRECFNKAYDVNVTGAHITAFTFMPLLLKSSDPRILFVAGLSQMTQAYEKYFPTPPQPAGWPKHVPFETIGYRCSKTALSMLMIDWNHKVKADGVKVWSVGPGMLDTNLGGQDVTDEFRELRKEMSKTMAIGHASVGAYVYKSVVEGERDDQVGKVVGKDGLIPL